MEMGNFKVKVGTMVTVPKWSSDLSSFTLEKINKVKPVRNCKSKKYPINYENIICVDNKFTVKVSILSDVK